MGIRNFNSLPPPQKKKLFLGKQSIGGAFAPPKLSLQLFVFNNVKSILHDVPHAYLCVYQPYLINTYCSKRLVEGEGNSEIWWLWGIGECGRKSDKVVSKTNISKKSQ